MGQTYLNDIMSRRLKRIMSPTHVEIFSPLMSKYQSSKQCSYSQTQIPKWHIYTYRYIYHPFKTRFESPCSPTLMDSETVLGLLQERLILELHNNNKSLCCLSIVLSDQDYNVPGLF